MMIQEPPEPPVALFSGEEDDDDFNNSTRLPDEIYCYRHNRNRALIMEWKRSGFGYTHSAVRIKGADLMKIMLN